MTALEKNKHFTLKELLNDIVNKIEDNIPYKVDDLYFYKNRCAIKFTTKIFKIVLSSKNINFHDNFFSSLKIKLCDETETIEFSDIFKDNVEVVRVSSEDSNKTLEKINKLYCVIDFKKDEDITYDYFVKTISKYIIEFIKFYI